MEQSDLDLLQTAPSSHLQAVVKARQVPLTAKGQGTTSSPTPPSPVSGSSASSAGANSSTSPPAISANIIEIAQHLFATEAIVRILDGLNELEHIILSELVACGGRANSRDLAFYLNSGGFLKHARKDIFPETDENGNLALDTDITRYQTATFSSSVSGMPGVSSLAGTQMPQYPTAHPHGLYEQALRHLLVLGLVFWGKQTSFASRDYTSGTHDGVLIVPQTVRNAVRTTWGEAQPLVSVEQGPAAGVMEEAGRSLQRSLYLYWSLVASQREGLTLIGNGQLARASLRLVLEHMGYVRAPGEAQRVESDVPSLLFIRLLLTKLGLLQERHGVLYATPGELFFDLPLLERARRCYRLWLETPLWNEMNYLPEVSVRPGPGPLEAAHEEVMHARQSVVERLTFEAMSEWHEIAAFVARTKIYIPYLLFPRQYGPRTERYSSGSNPYGWDFRLRRGWLTHREGWHMVEGGFIRTIVSGPLHWLGLVELDQEEGATSFRLSPACGLIMSDTPPAENGEIAWGRLIVQPNFELVVLAPVAETLLISLDRFAERVSLEHIAQYRLTKASVTHAIQMGLHADTIQAILGKAAGTDIPQNVQYSLVEWERQARRIEIWQGATLLEVDDAALLDRLLTDERSRALLGRRLTPLLIEVAPHKLEEVQALLWHDSYLPAFVTAPTQDATSSEGGRMVVREPQWRLHSDGLLQPFYAVTDLYLAAEAARFSEVDEMSGWRKITPISLGKALDGGLLLEHIVRFLQQYCEGGIPGSLLIRLKLWGSGYTERQTIRVESAPLLRLSEQVLRDIQADEELGSLLGTELDASSRLVRVNADNLERVLELLRERGFSAE